MKEDWNEVSRIAAKAIEIADILLRKQDIRLAYLQGKIDALDSCV